LVGGHRIIYALAYQQCIQTGLAIIPASFNRGRSDRQGIYGLRLILSSQECKQNRINILECAQIDVDAHRRSAEQDPLFGTFFAEPELEELYGGIQFGRIVLEFGSQGEGGSHFQFHSTAIIANSRIGCKFDNIS